MKRSSNEVTVQLIIRLEKASGCTLTIKICLLQKWSDHEKFNSSLKICNNGVMTSNSIIVRRNAKTKLLLSAAILIVGVFFYEFSSNQLRTVQ